MVESESCYSFSENSDDRVHILSSSAPCYTAEHTTLTPADLGPGWPHNSGVFRTGWSHSPRERESSALAHGFFRGHSDSLFRSGRSFQHSFFQHCCCLLLFAFFTPTDFPPGTAKIFPLILLGSPFFFELFFAFSHGHCFRGFFLREVPPHNKAFQVILFSWHVQLLAVRRSLSRSPA